jgi:hypothetical protein
MRGSPLVRTFLVLLALLGAGLGISRLSKLSRPPAPPPPPAPAPLAEDSVSAPFFLTFSSPPAEVRIEGAGREVTLQPRGVTSTGSLTLSSGHSALFVSIHWIDSDPAVPRFAKLTLEPAGHPTLTRTFDGFGGIDDVWEINLRP